MRGHLAAALPDSPKGFAQLNLPGWMPVTLTGAWAVCAPTDKGETVGEGEA